MKTAVLWALVAVNGLLLLSLLGLTVSPSAHAQADTTRRPGEYLMIDGDIPGSTSGLVYVVDTVNNQLSAITFPDSGPTSSVQSMPPIDLNQLFGSATPPVQPKQQQPPARPNHSM